MKIPKLMELVGNGNRTEFVRCEDYQLWYQIKYAGVPEYEAGEFQYPIPLDETQNAAFLRDDKALIHMRWIRRHLDFLTMCQSEKT